MDADTFKQIFRDHWDAFKARYPTFDMPDYKTAVQKMLDCGDPEKMGYVQYRCLFCGETRRIAFTCKSCFCLSCAQPRMAQWSDFIGRRLLPGVTYRHFVLTTADFLRHWFYQDSDLLSQLMRTGYACLEDIFQITAGKPLDIGCVMVLQTYGRSGEFNPHLHILVTAGGLTEQGTWKAVTFIPYELMHKKWQYHLLRMLREHIDDPRVQQDIDRGWKNYPNGFVAYLQPGDVPPGGKGLAEYLAKYVVSPPISVRRLEDYDGHQVSYWYEDHKTQAIEHATLPVLRFIGRMVQHILPKGFQRIRHFGLHSHTRYQQVRERLATLRPASTPLDPRGYRVLPRPAFTQLFLATFGQAPLLCPRCGTPMDWELLYHPEYGILKQAQLFEEDPPHERTASECSGLAAADVGEDPLAHPITLVQLPLPFL
ncbi:MAG: transposase [Candidatus Deferrimicrobiaceae bacterium]